MKNFLTRTAAAAVAWALMLPNAGFAQSATPTQAAAQPTAQASTAKAFSQEQLDQMLAPIALYPDALLAQVLMASTYPLEVVSAARWVQANPKVTGKALEDAMKKQTWDPSVKSLAAFPTVLQMMNEKIEWTQQLGDAFLAQRAEMMASVQALRHKAYAQGNLKSTTRQKVVVEKQTIIIEPASTTVYVPVYNPTVVYGTWWYSGYVPYYWYPAGYVAAPGPGLGFATGVVVGAALWGGCNWRGNDVTINVNRYNQFNHTSITHASWQHNAAHRQGVPYRDATIAQKYNRNQAADGAKRDANRKQAEQRAPDGRSQSNRGAAPDAARSGDGQGRVAPVGADRSGGGQRDRPDLGDNGPGRGGSDRGGPGGNPGRPGPGKG
jgi:hypothetical protein